MLSAVIEEKRTIKLSPDNSVTLRGLNMEDFAILLNNYQEIMILLFGGGLKGKSASEIGKELLVRFPSFAYMVIALAADEPESAEKVAALPFPTQVELLANVSNLTMPEGVKEGAKKIVSAIGMLTKAPRN